MCQRQVMTNRIKIHQFRSHRKNFVWLPFRDAYSDWKNLSTFIIITSNAIGPCKGFPENRFFDTKWHLWSQIRPILPIPAHEVKFEVYMRWEMSRDTSNPNMHQLEMIIRWSVLNRIFEECLRKKLNKIFFLPTKRTWFNAVAMWNALGYPRSIVSCWTGYFQ